MMKYLICNAVALLAAVLATAVTASIVQTQVNVSALVDLGAVVPAWTRLVVTVEDLARFGPIMLGIAAAALVPALSAGHMLARMVPRTWRAPLLGLAGVVGLWAAILLMSLVTPMPALLEATRGRTGLLLMCLSAIPGGLVYAAMTRPAGARRTNRHNLLLGLVFVAVPALCFFMMSPKAGDKVDQVDSARYVVQTVATGLNRPWSVAFLPDGRRLITEVQGRMLLVPADGTAGSTTFAGDKLPVVLDNMASILDDGATSTLMEVVPDPEFDQNRLLYLSVTYGGQDAYGTGIVRARLTDDRLEDVRVLFRSAPTSSSGNNGGRMAFLHDGTLALTVGDGLDWREQAQNPANHLGKVIRIDREGRAPADNPFYGKPGVAQEIYSLGHRNPQGIALDPVSGAVLISEHGARGGDELNLIESGKNYGWPVVTGGIDYSFARVTPFVRRDGYTDPALTWTPSIAPAGLAVYDGTLFSEWQGDLFVPALKERAVRRVVREQGRIVGQELLLADFNERMRDVKVAPDGSIHVLTDGKDAKLLRLVPPGPTGP